MRSSAPSRSSRPTNSSACSAGFKWVSTAHCANFHHRANSMTSSVVLITGALTGIGRATATAFARDGARVIVSGRHDDAGRALVSELGALGFDAEFVRADV